MKRSESERRWIKTMGIIPGLEHINTLDMLLFNFLKLLLHQRVCYRKYCMTLSAGAHAEMTDS